MEAFLVSIGLGALAEFGDRTQLLVLVLAVKFRRPIPIILGILVATLVNHALAGATGVWITSLINPAVMRWVLGISIYAMGVWILIPKKINQEENPPPRFGAFLTTSVAFFLLEIGDKAQIATIALAANYNDMVAVVAGTTAGIMLANVPVVLFGDVMAKKLPMALAQGIAALIFFLLGTFVLLGFSTLF